MVTLHIRWRILLAPLCWLSGHLPYGVEAGTWADDSGYCCSRCARWWSLYRCTCGHSIVRHRWEGMGHPVAWCGAEGCGCAAFVSEWDDHDLKQQAKRRRKERAK